MKRTILVGLLIGALLGSHAFAATVADEQLLELDRNRTSVDYYDSANDRMDESYRTTIDAMMSVLQGHKWITDDPELKDAGFTFKQKTDLKWNWDDPKVKLGYFVDVDRYSYEQHLTKRMHYAWQSPIDGYVNLQGWDSTDWNLHIKVVSDTEFDMYFHTGSRDKRFRFYRTDEFKKNPNPPKPRKYDNIF